MNDVKKITELELVSTQQLKAMLQANDEAERQAMQRVALANEEGVLARDPSNGNFEVVDDVHLQSILKRDASLAKADAADISLVPISPAGESGEDELSLVSTQALRLALKGPEPVVEEPEIDSGGSFDPYNSG